MLFIFMYSAKLGLRPVVNIGGNLSTQVKPPPNPKSLSTFSHALNSIQGSGSGERQYAVSGNTDRSHMDEEV